MILRISFLFLIALMITSCSAINRKEYTYRLDEAIRSYDKALRWAEYRSAASYHVGRDKKPMVIDIEKVNKFNVTGINILEKTIDPEATEASILAEISYYDKEYGTVKTLRQEQLWWRVPDESTWLIESEFPKFE